MRLCLLALLLAACHGAARPSAPAAPDVTGVVTASSGATRGTLFVTWLTTDEAATLGSGQPSMQVIRNLLTRGIVVGDVDAAHGAAYSIHPARGHDVLVATLDVSHVGIQAILGAGDGTQVGMSQPLDVAGVPVAAPPIALAPQPQPPAQERCTGDRVTLEHVEAPEVAGTVGNPTSRRLCVRVPKDYADHPDRHYPVIYVLPGLFSNDAATLEYPLDDTGAITVGVDTSTRTGSTYLTDSATSGQWDTFFTRDVIPFIDAHYRTLPHREARAVVGHSTGGFNAMSYGLRHPDLIGVIGASSPDGLDLRAWLADGDHPRDWLRDWQRVEHGFGGAGQLISYAADWSPTPGGYDWPFDASGEFVERVLDRWIANSPASLLKDPSLAPKDKVLSGHIYLTVGDADEFDLTRPTVTFGDELTAAGLAHQLVITHGGHVTHEGDQMAAVGAFCAAQLEAAH